MKIVRKVRLDLQLLQLRRSHSNGLQRGLHQHGVVVLHLCDTIGMGMVNLGFKASTMCITAQQLKRGVRAMAAAAMHACPQSELPDASAATPQPDLHVGDGSVARRVVHAARPWRHVHNRPHAGISHHLMPLGTHQRHALDPTRRSRPVMTSLSSCPCRIDPSWHGCQAATLG